MEMNQPDTANLTFAIMVDALLRLGPVDIGFESAKVLYALQAWASRRVVAALRQGGTKERRLACRRGIGMASPHTCHSWQRTRCMKSEEGLRSPSAWVHQDLFRP